MLLRLRRCKKGKNNSICVFFFCKVELTKKYRIKINFHLRVRKFEGR